MTPEQQALEAVVKAARDISRQFPPGWPEIRALRDALAALDQTREEGAEPPLEKRGRDRTCGECGYGYVAAEGHTCRRTGVTIPPESAGTSKRGGPSA